MKTPARPDMQDEQVLVEWCFLYVLCGVLNTFPFDAEK